MRDATIATHCSRGLKRDIQEIAEQRDQSVSELVRELLKDEVHEQNVEDTVRETKAIERVEGVIAEERNKIKQEVEEFKKVAKRVQETTAKGAVYAAANHQLHDVGRKRRDDARSTAASVLQDDLLEGLDIDPDAFEVAVDNGNGGSDTDDLWEDDE